MSILFASSHAIDFFKLSGSVNTASIPAAYDANYVKETLRGQSNAVCWRLRPFAITDHYVQFKQYSTHLSGNNGTQCQFTYDDGTTATALLRIVQGGGYSGTGNTVQFQYWNNSTSAWVAVGAATGLTDNVLYTYTFRIKIHATVGEVSFYINNALIGQFTGDTRFAGKTSVTYLDLFNPSIGSGVNGDTDWAEFIITANENPYAMRVKTHVLNGVGTTTAWSGAYTDVDEADPSTTDIISAATAGLVSTFATDDLPAIGADVIRAVQVSVMARRGATGPQNIQTVLRASGVDQTGTTTLLTTGYNTYRNIYEQNSVTGVEFTKAEIDASEVGVKSIT